MRVMPAQRSVSVYQNNTRETKPGFKADVKVLNKSYNYFIKRERNGSIISLVAGTINHFKEIGDERMKVTIELLGTEPPRMEIKAAFEPALETGRDLMKKYYFDMSERARRGIEKEDLYYLEMLRIPMPIWGGDLPGYGNMKKYNVEQYMKELKETYPVSTAEKDIFLRKVEKEPNPRGFMSEKEKRDDDIAKRVLRILFGKPPEV